MEIAKLEHINVTNADKTSRTLKTRESKVRLLNRYMYHNTKKGEYNRSDNLTFLPRPLRQHTRRQLLRDLC